MFNESPACTNKGNSDEQKRTLQSERNRHHSERLYFTTFPLLPRFSPTISKATNPNKCLAIHSFGKCLSYNSETDVLSYNCVSQQYYASFTIVNTCNLFLGESSIHHHEHEKTLAAVPSYHSHQEQIRYLNISMNKAKQSISSPFTPPPR